MRLIDTIARAGRSLRQAKVRTLLTSLAIGVGAFTITLSLAAGAGGRQYAQNLVNANTNDREISVAQKQDDSFESLDFSKPQEYSEDPMISLGQGINIKQLSQADIDKIAKIEGVESVIPAYNLTIKYVTAQGAKKYQASVEAYDRNIALEVEAGTIKDLGEYDIILPSSFVEVLGLGTPEQAIGKTVDVEVAQGSSVLVPVSKTFPFTVKGVIGVNPLAFSAGGNLLITQAAMKELYEYNTEGTQKYGVYIGAYVYVKDAADADKVRDKINEMGYDAQSAEDMLSTLFQFINVLQAILLGFGALAILTSVFGIINTQYISVLERTQQIGLMKALGMRRRDVGRLFKLEAAWIGFLGGAIGAGLAILAGAIANPHITDYLKLGEGNYLLIFEPWAPASVIIGLMVVAVLAGILPARKASKLDPIEALRTE